MAKVTVTVTVEGLAELNANLLKFGKILAGQAVTDALREGAFVIRNEAKRLAPVLDADTLRRKRGALRTGISAYPVAWNQVVVRVRSRGYIFDKNDPKARKAGNANYWWLLEFGTSKMPAKPFLRPAFEAKKMEALEVIRTRLIKNFELASAGLFRVKQRVRGRWK